MDRLTFAAEFIKAAAWPVATIITILLAKDPLVHTIRELKSLKWNKLEVEFDKEVKETKAVADRLLLPTPTSEDVTINDAQSRLLKLAEVSPKSAVFEAWLNVERELDSYLERHKDSDIALSTAGILEKVSILRKKELLDDHRILLLDSLRQLRNKAVHEHENGITEDSALSYISMAEELIRFFRIQ